MSFAFLNSWVSSHSQKVVVLVLQTAGNGIFSYLGHLEPLVHSYSAVQSNRTLRQSAWSTPTHESHASICRCNFVIAEPPRKAASKTSWKHACARHHPQKAKDKKRMKGTLKRPIMVLAIVPVTSNNSDWLEGLLALRDHNCATLGFLKGDAATQT